MPPKNKPIIVEKIDFSHTMDTFFSDYEETDHKVETDDDGIQRHIVTDAESYDARTAEDHKQASAEEDEKESWREFHERMND